MNPALIVDQYQTKKIFTIEELVNMEIDVPEIQRSPDDDRISEIVEFQVNHCRKNGTFCFLGELTMYSSRCDDKIEKDTNASSWLIIDGMHRYLAMKSPLLYEMLPTYKICVNIIYGSNSLSLDQAFLLINKSRPVPNYVIETTLEKSKRLILDDIRRFILKEYKNYLSKSVNPRLPNFNLDNFLSCLVKSPMLSLLPTLDSIFGYIKFANIKLKDSEPPHSRIKKAINTKCEKLNLGASASAYFGSDLRFEWMCDRSWIKEYIDAKTCIVTKNEVIEEDRKEGKVQINRKGISKVMRQKIWNRFYGNHMYGQCKCCQMNKISYWNFDAGHIVAHKDGGSSMVNNFAPICRPCNLGMGVENMNAFAKRMNGDTNNVTDWLYVCDVNDDNLENLENLEKNALENTSKTKKRNREDQENLSSQKKIEFMEVDKQPNDRIE